MPKKPASPNVNRQDIMMQLIKWRGDSSDRSNRMMLQDFARRFQAAARAARDLAFELGVRELPGNLYLPPPDPKLWRNLDRLRREALKPDDRGGLEIFLDNFGYSEIEQRVGEPLMAQKVLNRRLPKLPSPAKKDERERILLDFYPYNGRSMMELAYGFRRLAHIADDMVSAGKEEPARGRGRPREAALESLVLWADQNGVTPRQLAEVCVTGLEFKPLRPIDKKNGETEIDAWTSLFSQALYRAKKSART